MIWDPFFFASKKYYFCYKAMWSCLYVLKVCVCECEDMGSSAGVFACVCVRVCVCVCLCVCVDVYGHTAETVTTDESIFPTTENHLTY